MLIGLTRPVSSSLDRCELSYLPRQPIDLALAQVQHHAYEQTLRELGIWVFALPTLDHLPDAVFVEDTAVVVQEVAILANMGVASREPEVESMSEALKPYRSLIRLPAGARLEGGDVVHAGRTLYVGQTRRTNQAGIAALRSTLEPFGYRVLPVPVTGCLHLKSGCSALDPGTLLVNREWVSTAAFEGVELMDVPAAEPAGANVLVVGAHVLLPSAFPETKRLLEHRGFMTHPVELSELLKAEAGVTCESVIFES